MRGNRQVKRSQRKQQRRKGKWNEGKLKEMRKRDQKKEKQRRRVPRWSKEGKEGDKRWRYKQNGNKETIGGIISCCKLILQHERREKRNEERRTSYVMEEAIKAKWNEEMREGWRKSREDASSAMIWQKQRKRRRGALETEGQSERVFCF